MPIAKKRVLKKGELKGKKIKKTSPAKKESKLTKKEKEIEKENDRLRATHRMVDVGALQRSCLFDTTTK